MVGFAMLQEYIEGEDPDGEEFEARSAAWSELVCEPTDHITGAALFVRAEVFRDVGLIDPGYFAYAEEDDLERRAGKVGYRMVRVNVPLWHYNGGFWRKRLLRSSALAMRSSIRYMLKNETRHEIVRQIRWTVDFACSRDVEYDERIPHFRRLRPSHRVVNGAILAYALMWNLVSLPMTVRVRREHERRIIEAQRRREQREAAKHGQGTLVA
jgi:GT2 family glycosyltransferase